MRAALAGACGAALVMLCGGVQVSAQELRIETAEHNDALTVNASAVMQVRLATAWSVISDYDHLADFVPDMQSSRVLQRDGNQVLLEQKGSLGFLFFRQAIEVRLAVTEWPQQRITAHAIGGNLKQMDGSYTLETQADGRVRLAYSARLVPAFAIPPLVGKPVLRQLLKRQFRALVNEIQRREALKLQEHKQTPEN